jgi:replicative DNA helicase
LSDIGYSGRHVVGYGDIMRGKIEPEDVWRLEDCEKQLRSMPLVMDDSSGATLAQISARVRSERDRMAKAGTKLGLVVWDYLKFIKASDRYSGQRHYEVGEISVGLKRICLDFGVCGLLMAQLNRQTEGRDDKRPQLADLRESGDLEADADVVAFVYREAYYADRAAGAKNGDPDLIRQAVDAQNKLELIVAKNRTGATRTHHLWCDIRCSKISAHTHGEG